MSGLVREFWFWLDDDDKGLVSITGRRSLIESLQIAKLQMNWILTA